MSKKKFKTTLEEAPFMKDYPTIKSEKLNLFHDGCIDSEYEWIHECFEKIGFFNLKLPKEVVAHVNEKCFFMLAETRCISGKTFKEYCKGDVILIPQTPNDYELDELVVNIARSFLGENANYSIDCDSDRRVCECIHSWGYLTFHAYFPTLDMLGHYPCNARFNCCDGGNVAHCPI